MTVALPDLQWVAGRSGVRHAKLPSQVFTLCSSRYAGGVDEFPVTRDCKVCELRLEGFRNADRVMGSSDFDRARRDHLLLYMKAHQQVKQAFGSARARSCAICGAPARDWAHDGTHDDRNYTLVWVRNVAGMVLRHSFSPYSLRPDRYMPLCSGCHARFDNRRVAAFRAGCRR